VHQAYLAARQKRWFSVRCTGQIFQSLLLCCSMALSTTALSALNGCTTRSGAGREPRTVAPPKPAEKPDFSAAAEPAGVLKPQKVLHTFYAMGTEVRMTLWSAAQGATLQPTFAAAEALFNQLERQMTTWPHPGWAPSDIMRLNAAAGVRPVKISPETLEVLQQAQALSAATDGAFDVTVGALFDLWHFDADLLPQLPASARVAAALASVNYRDLVLWPQQCKAFLRHPNMAVTLGGIAKGYALDQLAGLLQSRGCTNFLLQAGGDLFAAGRCNGAPWRVAVTDPRDVSLQAHLGKATLEIPPQGAAFSTAGDYERGFVLHGQRYHHILDPTTGYPVRRCRSVSVVAPSAMLADALGDALFVLGADAGFLLLQRYPAAHAIIVEANGNVRSSAGWTVL
jgi:thiamine biosynthesis lipoprotein